MEDECSWNVHSGQTQVDTRAVQAFVCIGLEGKERLRRRADVWGFHHTGQSQSHEVCPDFVRHKVLPLSYKY